MNLAMLNENYLNHQKVVVFLVFSILFFTLLIENSVLVKEEVTAKFLSWLLCISNCLMIFQLSIVNVICLLLRDKWDQVSIGKISRVGT